MNSRSTLLFASLRLVLPALVVIMLSSCGSQSTRIKPPPSGMGVLDVTPDASRRDRISGMAVVSVNGNSARGDEVELSPGKNQVRVRFDWPQGGNQEVDLEFKVKPGTIYVVYYDVHPPVSRHAGGFERGTEGLLSSGSSDPYGAIAAVFAAAATTPFVVAEKSVNRGGENSVVANYVDVMAVAQKSPDGIVCNRRVYPDGKIEDR